MPYIILYDIELHNIRLYHNISRDIMPYCPTLLCIISYCIMCVNTSHTCAGRFDMWGSCRWHTAEGFLRRRIRMDAGRHQTVQRWNWCLSTACHWSSPNGAPQAHPGQELQTDPSLSETESTDNEKWETILFAKKFKICWKINENSWTV